MSNAMRLGKRTLAGVAAGALTAGLIPFAVVATATSAQAATTLSVDQSIARAGVTVDLATATTNSSDDTAPAMRVYVQPSADITGLNTGAGTVNVRIDSKPTGAGVALGTVYQSDTIAGTTLADDSIVGVDLVENNNANTLAAFNVAGNYGVTVWVAPAGATTVGAGNVTYLGNVTVAGVPTSIAFGQAAQSGPADVAADNSVVLKDSSGRVTRLGTGETVPLSTAQTTGTDDTLYIATSNPSSATTLNFGVGNATALTASAGVTFDYQVKAAAGSVGAFTTTAAGAGIGIASNPTSVFTVQAQTTAKNIDVSATNLASDWEGPVTADDTTEVRSDTTALTFTITADDTATAGELLPATFTFSGATAVTVDGAAIASGETIYKAIGSGKTAAFAVAVTGPSASTVVTATTGAAINADLRVDWDDAVFGLATTPADGSSVVLAPGATASIVAQAGDQFGNPYVGACINGSNGTTTTATQTTGADGTVTVSIPAPATGTSATLTVTAKTQGCASALAVGTPSTITATYGTPVITLTGVSTSSVDETVAVPSQVTGSNNFKAVTANVTVNGSNVPNGTLVDFSGSSGVRFGAASTGTWADATATKQAAVAGGAGNVTVYVTAAEAGTATVNAAVAGVVASGNLTVQTVAGTSRFVAMEAPAVAESGTIVPVAIEVVDGFGNGMAGIDVDVEIPISSIGRFANGSRAITVTTNASGEAVADVTTGINEKGVLAVLATLDVAAQSEDAANVPAGTGFLAGQRSTSVAIEVDSAPVEPALFITAYRSGGNVIVDGDSDGFERRDVVTLEIRSYNNKKKKWRSWKAKGEVFIKSDGSFSGIIATTAKVRVRAVSGEVKSNSLVIQK